MNQKKTFITIVLLIITIYSIGMYFAIKESDKCDERVTLNDGTVIDCTNAWHDDMMTHLNTCDGEKMEVPTNRIKHIKQIN